MRIFLLSALWAAMQIGFALTLLSAFLERKLRQGQALWITVGVWVLTAAYGLLGLEGVYGYLAYLLAVTILLLTVFGEYGGKGLGLLAFAFLLPFLADAAAAKIGTEVWIITLGKLLPLALALILKGLGLFPRENRQEKAARDRLLLQQHMEMQRESMAALEQNYRAQRKSAHEFEHHMQVLRDLLAQGQSQAAGDYLQRLKKNRSIRVMRVSSNHPVIDVILSQKYQTALENEIKMQIQVNDLSAVTVATDSLVVVLTNLLDNAIEACRRVDGYREIFCSVIDDDGLCISIRNTSEPVDVVQGKIPTSKADSLSHGFGLLSVGYVLDELGAAYTFGYADGWFHFTAEIES